MATSQKLTELTLADGTATKSKSDGLARSEANDYNSLFPFLFDADSVEHIRNSKVMFVMRGLPGSGKSYVVKQIESVYPDAVTCSADDYFTSENGTYNYEPSKLSAAHNACQVKASRLAADEKLHIVIDNTNIRQWEMKPYFIVASRCGYVVLLVVPQTPWASDPVQLSKRNTHECTVDYITARLNQFEDAVPSYWAWFVNGKDSDRLGDLGEKYFQRYVSSRSDFAEFDHTEGESNLTLDRLYWTKNVNLHCTAYYIGLKNRSKEVMAYCNSDVVKRSVGVKTELTVVAVVFTRRTAGFRVLLTSEQLKLFNKDDAVILPSDQNHVMHDKRAPPTSVVTSKEAKRPASCDVGQELEMLADGVEATSLEAVDSADQDQFPSLSHAVNVSSTSHTSGTSSSSDDVSSTTSARDATCSNAKHSLSNTSMELTNKKVKAFDAEKAGREQVDVWADTLVSTESSPAAENADREQQTAVIDPASIICEVPSEELGKIAGSQSQKQQQQYLLPRGCSAHLTLAYAKSCQASQTGDDMVDVLRCEETSGSELPGVVIDGDGDDTALLKYYGKGRYMITFKQPIIINALFAGKF